MNERTYDSVAAKAYGVVSWFQVEHAKDLGPWAESWSRLGLTMYEYADEFSLEVHMTLWAMCEDDSVPFYVRMMAALLASGLDNAGEAP